ncbi:hypothetical protein BATDEDRAFT_23859 [Batrachochytrium dendrobatidis JAM81]|uniref:Uncharacterized protein n=2 Tax=Batrachochytrium dendrobatidis TaxID=109871 RepID=F4NZG9_BATDJ|nr:uncharacterized protein BATDEDRAFT_23859 [Batrachochytrium dendrobatidis JAM81]EGF81435.1 hypothetical protein BATDEDRAFT_23859 [Batrachochytrium dendrobatidis JAM81]KAK5669921.1 hypothetical protein QVD99_004293 [Batrachochytrium dendrobatidis]OAJ38486.1 hypothetical protein BDEG_22405 [Batrachochytrium dendrobatidis JEL423]|eukprot:XP_006677858.1 hypothetical protein BATDEDRAFT_23859 [Batrachochytrium dendrobatidis JAM81]
MRVQLLIALIGSISVIATNNSSNEYGIYLRSFGRLADLVKRQLGPEPQPSSTIIPPTAPQPVSTVSPQSVPSAIPQSVPAIPQPSSSPTVRPANNPTVTIGNPSQPRVAPISSAPAPSSPVNSPSLPRNVGDTLPTLPALVDPPRGTATSSAPTDASAAALNSPQSNSYFPYYVVGAFFGVILIGAIGTLIYNKYIYPDDDDHSPVSLHKTGSTKLPVNGSKSASSNIMYSNNTKPSNNLQFASYDTMGRSGGPGVVVQKQEYYIDNSIPNLDQSRFASYETLGRPSGPGTLVQTDEYGMIPSDWQQSSKPSPPPMSSYAVSHPNRGSPIRTKTYPPPSHMSNLPFTQRPSPPLQSKNSYKRG